MRSIKLLTTFLIIFEVGCVTVQRPDTDLCVVNAGAGHLKCYNMKKDFDDQGNRKPDAAATFKPAKTVDDLNKFVCTDLQGFENLKIYLNELKAAAQRSCK